MDSDRQNLEFPLIAETMHVENLAKFLPKDLVQKLNLKNEMSPKRKMEEEEKKQGQQSSDHYLQSNQGGKAMSPRSKLVNNFESKISLDDDFSDDMPEGEIDETCIAESPEMRTKSTITNIMVEQNKKSLQKFANPPNPSSRMRGIKEVRNSPNRMSPIHSRRHTDYLTFTT